MRIDQPTQHGCNSFRNTNHNITCYIYSKHAYMRAQRRRHAIYREAMTITRIK